MSMAFILIKRNIKLFFKDKGMFFTSLITPAILLVLYVTFLGNVYRDSFTSNFPNSLKLSESIIEGLVGGQLISSILAVSCVTVAFCSNFLMVQDKANGTIRDLRISPVKSATLSLSYYVATLLSTLIICFAATGICLTYVAIVGWYMSLADIFFLFLDILLLVLFGTALTSVYKGYKRDKIEMRGDRAEISDFPLYLNTVAGGLDCRDQAISGFSFVVKIYAVPVVEIIG